ncbi:MAG: LytTR family transcriptional regulator DNA-binding domain-containing protein [Rhodocyclales bacterium]|nr:LytTR family transcriptional regulator DNA-binding domain-containing protein [Rhodocyclales bacterium]
MRRCSTSACRASPASKSRRASPHPAASFSSPPSDALLRELIARLGAAAAPAAPPLRWLRAGSGDSLRLIDVDEVDRFEAADKYTTIHVGAQEWLIRSSLRELEQQLAADAFWRIHRGTLVRVAAIREVRRDLMGRLWVELKSGGKPLPVSRSYAHLFRQM